MLSFSFVWFFTLFIFQVIEIGFQMGKLTLVKTTSRTTVAILISIILSTMTGLSLYWWPS